MKIDRTERNTFLEANIYEHDKIGRILSNSDNYSHRMTGAIK